MHQVQDAISREDVARCFPAIQELRPQFVADQFVEQVLRQQEFHGYKLMYIEFCGQVVACLGYRVAEYLAWGKVFYIDDVICRTDFRKQGFATSLMVEAKNRAHTLGCIELHLDSGVHRFEAHRLYMSQGMNISSHHFSMKA